MLGRLFPLWRTRNVAVFYLLNAVISAWFMAGVWVFIWGIFMTKPQIGLSDALTFAAGMVLEVPSGVIGDLVGRKRTIIFGHMCLVVGNIMIALSSSFAGITLWYLLWTVGYAAQSGTTEALAYDSLTKKQQQTDWPRIISTSIIISRTMSVLATAAGGLLFAVHFRLPYLAAGGFGIIGILAAFALRERKPTRTHNLRELTTYTSQIRDGISVLTRKAVWPIALASLTVISVAFLFNWGLLRPLTALRFGFNETTVPFVQAAGSLATAIALVYAAKLYKRFGVEKLIFLGTAIFGVLFASLFLPYPWVLGGMVMIAMGVTATYVEQFFSVFINLHTKSKHRATTLSAVSLITRAPFVATAVLIGFLAGQQQLAPFYVALGGIVLVILAVALVGYRRLQRTQPQT